MEEQQLLGGDILEVSSTALALMLTLAVLTLDADPYWRLSLFWSRIWTNELSAINSL